MTVLPAKAGRLARGLSDSKPGITGLGELLTAFFNVELCSLGFLVDLLRFFAKFHMWIK